MKEQKTKDIKHHRRKGAADEVCCIGSKIPPQITNDQLSEIHDGDLLNVLGLQEFFDKIAVDQHHDRLRYTAFRL